MVSSPICCMPAQLLLVNGCQNSGEESPSHTWYDNVINKCSEVRIVCFSFLEVLFWWGLTRKGNWVWDTYFDVSVKRFFLFIFWCKTFGFYILKFTVISLTSTLQNCNAIIDLLTDRLVLEDNQLFGRHFYVYIYLYLNSLELRVHWPFVTGYRLPFDFRRIKERTKKYYFCIAKIKECELLYDQSIA